MQENDNTLEEVHEEPEAPASRSTVGIRFRRCGKVYTFEVNGIEVRPGAKVVVESEMGLSIGQVVTPRCATEKTEGQLKKVIRLVSEEDLETIKSNRALEEEAKAFCAARAHELRLSMKIVSAETTLDKKRLVFYFSADGRIDFRELVRDLAGRFKTRIEMRQIGVRDEVKLLGGIGVCGREACCSLFLTNFAPVTIKMAKQQDLSINQSKLSGICGRLMCCLGYERKDTREEAPVRGEDVLTVTDEPADTGLQKPDQEVICTPVKRPDHSSRHREERKRPEGADAARKQEGGEGARDRHSRRRRRPEKRKLESALAEKPQQPAIETPRQAADSTLQEAPSQPKEQQPQGEAAEAKRKSSNRRKRFWHKKKPQA